MMRDNINFFRNYIDCEILGEKTPEGMPEFISPMRTIPVVPNRPVGAHHYHTINKRRQKSPPMKKRKKKNYKEWDQAAHFEPAEERQPILPSFKYIQPGKKFFQYLKDCWPNQITLGILPSIRGHL